VADFWQEVTRAGGIAPRPLFWGRTMITIFAVFVLTTALYGSLLFLAFRRVAAHLQGNAEATKSVVEHVVIPLLGRKPQTPVDKEAPKPRLPPKP
jgi:hypothetical protein